MKYLKKFDALDLDTYGGFNHYGLGRDKFMDITNELKIEIESVERSTL